MKQQFIRLFLLLIACAGMQTTSAQSLQKLERLLNKQIRQEMKEHLRTRGSSDDTLTLIRPFAIKDSTLTVTIKGVTPGSEGYWVEEQAVPLRLLRSLGKDGMLLFNTSELVERKMILYYEGEKTETTDKVPHFWLHITGGEKDEQLFQQLLELLEEAGYTVTAYEPWM